MEISNFRYQRRTDFRQCSGGLIRLGRQNQNLGCQRHVRLAANVFRRFPAKCPAPRPTGHGGELIRLDQPH